MITLRDIWTINHPEEYKVHFARTNYLDQPLDVFARDWKEWQGWQEHRPERDMFNREFIFSLMDFYHEKKAWLFGGIFKVTQRLPDRYEVRLVEDGKGFVGRLKLHSEYMSRSARVNFENHYSDFSVLEILKEPFSGKYFRDMRR